MSSTRPAPVARFHVDAVLPLGALIDLPPGAARHVQVLRLQPGAALRLFDGRGGEARARVERIGRSAVAVRVDGHEAVERELPLAVTLAVGMPANDRMDALVEKATELGAAAIVPLLAERSVLRLAGERADKRVAHWRGVAVAACEQCGRNRVPAIAPVQSLADWLRGAPPAGDAAMRWLLSLAGDAAPPAFGLVAPSVGATAPVPSTVAAAAGGTDAVDPAGAVDAVDAPGGSDAAGAAAPRRVWLLSGPEGGFTAAEEALARAAGFMPVTLGERVLRADTAPLALLSWLGIQAARQTAVQG